MCLFLVFLIVATKGYEVWFLFTFAYREHNFKDAELIRVPLFLSKIR